MSHPAPNPVDRLYVTAMRALRWTRRRILPVARCDVGGLEIRVGLASENEHFRAETYATKEPETLEWLRGELRAGDVFFDVGANIGLYALFAARLEPGCRVYAFEPESHNFSSLCRNTLLNGLSNLTPCSFALSDRDGFELLYVYDLSPGSSLHSLGSPSGFRAGPEVVRQGVLGCTLDTLVARHGLPHPSLLKLDVDGIEERILAGGREVLSSGRLRSILVEVTPDDGAPSWAERALARFGYRLARKSDWVLEVNGLQSRNCIFTL